MRWGIEATTGEVIMGNRNGVWLTRTVQRKTARDRWDERHCEGGSSTPAREGISGQSRREGNETNEVEPRGRTHGCTTNNDNDNEFEQQQQQHHRDQQQHHDDTDDDTDNTTETTTTTTITTTLRSHFGSRLVNIPNRISAGLGRSRSLFGTGTKLQCDVQAVVSKEQWFASFGRSSCAFLF